MVQIRLKNGQRLDAAKVDLSHPRWVVADVHGDSVQYLPLSNVHRILSKDGDDVYLEPEHQLGEDN